jgi:hypothetical protein
MYNMTKEKEKHSLQSTDTLIITMDGWTSIRNESNLAVTAHYINSDMELLDCFKYGEKHMAINLAQEMKRVTCEWGTENKVWKNVQCFAHTLNLVVQYGIQSIKDLHIKLKIVFEFFRNSP